MTWACLKQGNIVYSWEASKREQAPIFLESEGRGQPESAGVKPANRWENFQLSEWEENWRLRSLSWAHSSPLGPTEAPVPSPRPVAGWLAAEPVFPP